MRARILALGAFAAGVLLALSGCAYVGQPLFEETRDDLDHDGDGSKFGGNNKDCDDFNSERFPGNDETPYDGWDNDCEGGDIVDVDGDGFPGITQAAYFEQNPDAEAWPSDVATDVLDCRDDPAVHPQARDIYPGNPNDVAYDGIDADCGGDNDFDFDGDGYLPPRFELGGQDHDTAAAFEAYVAEWGLSLSTPEYTDCDDFDPLVFLGSTEPDLLYDGVDTDCDGANDFDADGDGYMPDQEIHEGPYQLYLQKFHGGVAPWAIADWGDCLDQDSAAIPAAVPSEVFPGTVEVFYDGIDQNCNDGGEGQNDFDADDDKYMPDRAADPGANPHGATFDSYVEAWGLTFLDPAYGDCQDDDDTVFPGALERIGDGEDSDCDGNIDTTPFAFAGYTWENPRRPRVDATDDHYLVVSSAEFVDFVNSSSADVAVSLIFDKDAGTAAVPPLKSLWQGATNPQPLGDAVEVVTKGNTFWGLTTYTHRTSPLSYIVVRQVQYDIGLQNYVLREYDVQGTEIDSQYQGMDVDLILGENDGPWAVACGLFSGEDEIDLDVPPDGVPDLFVTDYGTVHAMRGIIGDPDHSGSLGPKQNNGWIGEGNVDRCFISVPPDPYSGLMYFDACDGVECRPYVFDPSAPLPFDRLNEENAPYDRYPADFVTADYEEGWLIFSRPTGVRIIGPDDTWDLLPGIAVEAVDASFDADGDPNTNDVHLVALIGDTVEVHFGDLDDQPLTTVVLDFEDPTRPDLDPFGAAVHADTDRLVVAVTATNTAPGAIREDAVGWVFLGWP